MLLAVSRADAPCIVSPVSRMVTLSSAMKCVQPEESDIDPDSMYLRVNVADESVYTDSDVFSTVRRLWQAAKVIAATIMKMMIDVCLMP